MISRLQLCRYFPLALLILFATLYSRAQQTSAPRTQIIHAGKLLDVRTGHIQTDAYITVIVKIAYGVDDDIDESVSREFGALVHGGMTSLEAMQAATIHGAELLSLDNDLGAIEPGKYADLVAVPSNPLDDITAMEHVAWVMKSGIVVKPL